MERETETCPACGGSRFYTLGDGRLKCRTCRRKFSPRSTTKVGTPTLERMDRMFLAMASAVKAASNLGVDRKTLQKRYRDIRMRIAAAREQELKALLGKKEIDWAAFSGTRRGSGSMPVMGLYVCGEKVCVLLPPKRGEQTPSPSQDKITPHWWVVAPDGQAALNLLIDKFGLHPAGGETSEHRADSLPVRFWAFTKNGLRKYRGGYRKNFPLFVREMEFRFNVRDDAQAMAYLNSIPSPVREK